MMIPNDEYMQHREELADKCRAMLGDYLRQRGDFKSGNYIKPLFPDRHKHGSTTSDCRYYPETQTVFDHGLKEKYDIFDYIREDYGLTGFYEQINKACELFNIDITPTAQIAPTTPKAPKQTTKTDENHREKGGVTMNFDFTGIIEKANAAALASPEALQHFKERGFDREDVERFKLGYSPDGWNALFTGDYSILQTKRAKQHLYKYIIPYPGKSYFVAEISDREQIDDYNKKYNFPALIKKPVFESTGGESDNFVLVEGQYDALSWTQAGFNAIATTATDALKSWAADHPEAVVMIAKDNDDAGRKQQEKDVQTLKAAGIMVYSADAGKVYGEHGDANKALNSDRKADILSGTARIFEIYRQKKQEQEAEAAAQRYKLTGAGMIDECLKSFQTRIFEPIPTGEPFFDYITDGGIRRQQLYMLAAAPALGKTTLLTQIAEDIAERGASCIYLNFEMSVQQLVAKSLSRYAYRHLLDDNGAKLSITADEIMRGYEWTPEQENAVKRAADGYKRDIAERFMYCDRDKMLNGAQNYGVYIESVIEYLEAEAAKAERDGKQTPFVFVDYLHLLSSRNERGKDDDIQTTLKKSVTELKAFAMRHNTSVFTILATNRDSNKAGKMILESGRDSSNIEYTADCFMGLNFADWESENKKTPDGKPATLENEKQENPRRIVIKNLKTRMNAGDGRIEPLLFDVTHGLFLWAEKNPFENDEPKEATTGASLREKYGKRGN